MQDLSRQRDASLVDLRKWPRPEVLAMPRHVPDTLSGRSADGGFTLIELLVATAVAVVLVMIAVPSFKSITLSNRLTTTANDIVAAISTARMEAVKLNAATQLCSNSAAGNTSDSLGTACGTQAGAVYALAGGAVTQVRAAPGGIASPLQLSGDLAALRFSSAGLARQAGQTTPFSNTVVDICTSSMSNNNHRVITMTTGSIITTTTTSGACP
ncbi:GspH/FimT family pseudopilin [Rhodanobacter sp. TND4FH1]